MTAKFEYAELFLSSIIKFYIENALREHDWSVLAIDPQKNTVILRRTEFTVEGE